jgi:hypothetical protein
VSPTRRTPPGTTLAAPVSAASPVVQDTGQDLTAVSTGRIGVFSQVYVVVSVLPKNVCRSSCVRISQPSPVTQNVHSVDRPFSTRHVRLTPQSAAVTVIVERRG